MFPNFNIFVTCLYQTDCLLLRKHFGYFSHQWENKCFHIALDAKHNIKDLFLLLIGLLYNIVRSSILIVMRSMLSKLRRIRMTAALFTDSTVIQGTMLMVMVQRSLFCIKQGREPVSVKKDTVVSLLHNKAPTILHRLPSFQPLCLPSSTQDGGIIDLNQKVNYSHVCKYQKF